MIILKHKLTSPRLSASIERRRLTELFAGAEQQQLLLIVAGAGYGKTTLAVQTLEAMGHPYIWYRLDETDGGFPIFINYLVAAFEQQTGHSFKNVKKALESYSKTDAERTTILLELLGSLENLDIKDLVLVFDDYHLVHLNDDISEAVIFLLERLPLAVRLMIISRYEPNLKVSRLRSQGRVLEINEHLLEFKAEEVKWFFNETKLSKLSNADIAALTQKTKGWAAGLVLLYHTLSNTTYSSVGDVLNQFGGFQKALSRYFDENVFGVQSTKIKSFMFKTSILTQLEPELCNRFLEIEDSASILAGLESNRFFTFFSDGDEPSYYYHHLLQEYLQSQFKTALSRSEKRRLCRRAAELYNDKGRQEEAIMILLEADLFDDASKMMESMDMNLFFNGKLPVVTSLIEKLPDVKLYQNPLLLYHKIKLLSLSGQPEQAFMNLDAAFSILRKTKSDRLKIRFQKEYGMLLYYTGDIKKSIQQLKLVVDNDNVEKDLMLELSGLLIFLNSVIGNIDEAKRYTKLAYSQIKGLPEEKKEIADTWVKINHSYCCFQSGNIADAIRLVNQALLGAGKQLSKIFEPLALFHTAYYLNTDGQFEKSAELAKKGIARAEELGFKDSQYAWLHLCYAQSCLGLNDIDSALSAANESLNIFEHLNNYWGIAHSHDMLHKLHVIQNDTFSAAKHIESGLALIKRKGLRITKGVLTLGKIGLQLQEGNLHEALHLTGTASKDLAPSKYYTCLVYIAKAAVLSLDQKTQKAVYQLKRGLHLAVEHQYNLRAAFELNPFWKALRILAPEEEIQHLWQKAGLSGEDGKPEPVSKLKKSVILNQEVEGGNSVLPTGRDSSTGLSVTCFGGFRVFRNSIEIPLDTWKSSAAEMLFKYLVHRYDRDFIPKDFLVEILWPAVDPNKGSHRFNVAVSALRKILEPERRKEQPSSYIIRHKNGYRVLLGPGGKVDVVEFQNKVKAARQLAFQSKDENEKLIHLLMEAESLYQGPFLEKELYVDWCILEREKLRSDYLWILENLIGLYTRLENHESAIHFSNKYLNEDPCAEVIYRGLMRSYAASNNHPMVMKTFNQCTKQLKLEMDCTVSGKTNLLYKQLVPGKGTN